MAAIIPQGKTQFFNTVAAGGAPLSGGKVFCYARGTTTYQNTYQDIGLTTPNTNPIILDANGEALIWGTGAYTLLVQDQYGNQIYQADTQAPLGNAADIATAIGGVPITTANGMPLVPTIAALRLVTSASAATAISVTNYALANDGGGGVFQLTTSDTTSADNGGTIIIDASGRRWYRSYAGGVNVKWFGATGNGTTNDTLAIQAAINAVSASGASRIDFPAGTYLASGLTISTANNIALEGVCQGNEAAGGVTLLSASQTANLLTVTGLSGIYLNRISFNSTTTMTAGNFVEFSGCNQCGIDNFSMTNGYNPLNVVNTSAFWSRHGEIRNFNGNGVSLGGSNTNGSADCYFDDIIMDQDNSNYTPSSGFLVTNSAGSFNLTNSDILHCNDGLLVIPGTGQIVSWIYMTNVYFDTTNFTNAGGNGIRIAPSGTGIVNGLTLADVWTSTGTIGLYAVGTSTATISDIQITNHRALNNYSQGMYFDYCDHISIVNPAVSGNSQAVPGTSGAPGINIGANCKSISITGGYCGKAETYGVTQSYGILVASGFTGNLTIQGVNLNGNASSGFINGGSPAAGSVVKDCPGWNPLGPATISVGASPFYYTASSLCEETISIYGGTGVVSSLNSGSFVLANASPASVTLRPGQQLGVSYSTAPTMITNRA